MKITDFFNTDYVDYSSYDNLRKIASLIDGQKNSSRKVLYTVLEKRIKDKIKVSQLGSKVAEFSEYLHGNLDGVIVNLAQDFAGSNNLPLLQKKGNFGTRHTPAASASRYIYTYGTDELFKLFNSDDNHILRHQQFEGSKIEPMFYVPTLPLLLINGSEGVSSGFAQKILPRNPDDIKDYIESSFKPNHSLPELIPYYKGFKGIIEQGDTSNQWVIKGKVQRTAINKVKITEVPIGYSWKTYIKVLDDLEEKGIIQNYVDKCENDEFCFIVTILSKTLKSWDDEALLSKLKLVKKITENYTVLDENNKIVVYESVHEILQHYIRVKLEYLEKRKLYIIEKMESDIRYDFSKLMFIKMIVNDELIINKRKKNDIVKDLEKNDNILKKDDSYDYLLSMNIVSLTEERMKKLEADIKSNKKELDLIIKKPINKIWLEEL